MKKALKITVYDKTTRFVTSIRCNYVNIVVNCVGHLI